MAGGWTVVPVSAPDLQHLWGFATVRYELQGAWIQITTSYEDRFVELTFIGYDPGRQRWSNLTIDRLGGARQLYARRWENGRAVFEGDVIVQGRRAHLRQSIARERARGPGDDDGLFTITSEERIGGRWRPVDSYRYVGRPVN